MSDRLSPGKVPWDFVANLLGGELPSDVLLGPAAGEDAALVKIGNELWAIASDPISFTATNAGTLAVYVNANDVAVRGATPRFFLAVVLLAPDEASPKKVQIILSQIQEACRRVGATLVGGHTEVTPGISQSIIVGTMLGQVIGRPLTTGGLRAGDFVGMTRSAGLEGTSILIAEMGDRLRLLHADESLTFDASLVSPDVLLVADEALLAAANPSVSALHDVTEGGTGEAIHEMENASGLEILVRRQDIPVLPETIALCADLGIDPLGLIGSGSILVGCSEEGHRELEAIFAERNVPFVWIGRAVVRDAITRKSIPRFPRDELLKASAIKNITAVIFDMDGTLVDSDYDWVAIRGKLGVSGPSIIDDLNSLPQAERQLKWKELETFEAEATSNAGLFAGANEILEFLAQEGIVTALVTNNNKTNTQDLLHRFQLSFDVVLTRDSGLWKPSGAPVVEATKRLDITPDHCLAVGDSHYDILAAREAEVAKVCVLHDSDGRHKAKTDLSFKDIPSFLRYLRLVVP